MSFSRHYKMSLLKPVLVGCAFIAASSTASSAATLRETLTTEASFVRLNDLFTDTGALGNEIVMPAPDPGQNKTITSFELTRIAAHYKLDWQRPAYLKRVQISREGTHFSTADLKPLILDQIREGGMDTDIEVKIYGRKKGFYLPTGYSADVLTFESFEVSDQQDRFSAVIALPVTENKQSSIRLSGRIQEVRLVPMFNRLVTPGEVIATEDIRWKKHPSKRVTMRSIVSTKSLVGQTVRRAIAPGKLLSKNDIVMPIVVAKGSTVSITLHSGALTLKAKGRALTDGGAGDTIRVMTTNSKRTIEAIVISPDKVEVHVRPAITLAAR